MPPSADSDAARRGHAGARAGARGRPGPGRIREAERRRGLPRANWTRRRLLPLARRPGAQKFDMRSVGRAAWPGCSSCCRPCSGSDRWSGRPSPRKWPSYLGVDRGLVLDQFRKRRRTKASAPRAAKRPIDAGRERLLLNALLVSAEARDEVLPRLIEHAGFRDALRHGAFLRPVALDDTRLAEDRFVFAIWRPA